MRDVQNTQKHKKPTGPLHVTGIPLAKTKNYTTKLGRSLDHFPKPSHEAILAILKEHTGQSSVKSRALCAGLSLQLNAGRRHTGPLDQGQELWHLNYEDKALPRLRHSCKQENMAKNYDVAWSELLRLPLKPSHGQDVNGQNTCRSKLCELTASGPPLH